MTGATPPSSPTMQDPQLPLRTRLIMITRLFAVQASWNYEILIGNGIGFCVEPALRLLPGGQGGDAYRAALARQSQYFNAHPYLSSFAVGALVRAELEGQPPVRIERFRTALCGPLGSVGDRLVWVGLLPTCSLARCSSLGSVCDPSSACWLSCCGTMQGTWHCDCGDCGWVGSAGCRSRRRSRTRFFARDPSGWHAQEHSSRALPFRSL